MANHPLDTALLDRAIVFAVQAHAGTERRGKGFPYIVHPMEAVSIVATMTSDQELLAAAALHDTVEDTDVTVAQVRELFGDRIAALVDAESDKPVAALSETASWRERKQAAIDRLAAASHDAKIVALGDKLSNMRAICRDYQVVGDKLWSRFHAPGGKADHEWHYRGLAVSLSSLSGNFAYTEFVTLIEQVFGDPKPERIDMNDYTQSGDGYTAITYNHKDGEKMVKLYSDFMPLSEPMKEIHVTWKLRDMGLNVPCAYRLVSDGQRVGVEFERIAPKKSFARAISNEPESLETYAVTFAHMCRQLHATPCDTTLFEPATEHFKKIVFTSSDFTDAEKATMAAFIDTVPPATTCLHGDMHIGNVITNGEDNWWIDLSDFRYGNPLFDLGMFYLATNLNDEELTQHLYHVSNAQMREVWRVFVREYFGAEASLEEVNALVAPYAALYMVYFGSRDKLYPPMRAFVEQTLLKK